MKPNSRQLALRDPALAAAMGILGAQGSNYGAEPNFGTEWSGDPSIYSEGYYGYHGDQPGFGYQGSPWGFGMEAVGGAAAKAAGVTTAHPLHPAQAQRTMAIVAKHNAETARTSHRESLLHPNKGSRVDIERYDFSLNATPFALGGGTVPITGMSTQPAVTVRPQRCTFNAPTVAFAQITAILSANVNGLVGGATDAGIYGPTSFGVHLDLPTLSPANKLQINGTYSGLVPTGFPIGFVFPFTASFQCPATVVA